jgi:hypothetical protein
LALDNAGTVELAVVNISGGTDLTETGLISTTAEGGAGAADSASVVYSTTARTNVAYRVVGYVESTQTTAGTWAVTPSTIQGYGGQALASMSSLGYGQIWRVAVLSTGATYYNTTGKPITVITGVTSNSAGYPTMTITVGGVVIVNAQAFDAGTAGLTQSFTFIVPPGASYVASIGGGGTPTLQTGAILS